MKTVKIGSQVWMAENLDVVKFRNGEFIPYAFINAEWGKAGREGMHVWCYYDNNQEYGKKYVKLYNWHAVNDARGLAPEGWHIPTHDEFLKLAITVNLNGEALKSAVQSKGNNSSGFSALMSGFRSDEGICYDLDNVTFLWSSTEENVGKANYMHLRANCKNIYLTSSNVAFGYSVRCLRD